MPPTGSRAAGAAASPVLDLPRRFWCPMAAGWLWEIMDPTMTEGCHIEPAHSTDPPLTTVRQPLRERGRIAGELILKALDGRRRQRIRMPTELIVRGSTAPPKP